MRQHKPPLCHSQNLPALRQAQAGEVVPWVENYHRNCASFQSVSRVFFRTYLINVAFLYSLFNSLIPPFCQETAVSLLGMVIWSGMAGVSDATAGAGASGVACKPDGQPTESVWRGWRLRGVLRGKLGVRNPSLLVVAEKKTQNWYAKWPKKKLR